MMRILFFGRVSDAAGCSEISVDVPCDLQTLGEVRAWLAKRDRVLGDLIFSPGIRAAVDRVFCTDDNCSVAGAAEIAFMSPLSGG